MLKRFHRAEGFTLIASLLVLLLLSALAIGLLFMVHGAGQIGSNDLETNVAYYGAASCFDRLRTTSSPFVGSGSLVLMGQPQVRTRRRGRTR